MRYIMFMIYTTLGLIFSILAAGAVDGDASLTTLSICSAVGITFLLLAMFENFKNGQ